MRNAALFGLMMLSGCMSSSHIRPLRPLEIAAAPYQETVTASPTGSLMYEGGCLLFRDDATKGRLLPVWPLGSVFNGTSVIFHQPANADQRIVIGEEFVMEGQPLGWPALPSASYLPFRHQCGAQPFFVSRVRPAD